MYDTFCKCFTGRISRLINTLNGYYSLVYIQINDSQQIGNIIVITKEKLLIEKIYSVDIHKEIVKKELTEKGYNDDIINEWVSFIE